MREISALPDFLKAYYTVADRAKIIEQTCVPLNHSALDFGKALKFKNHVLSTADPNKWRPLYYIVLAYMYCFQSDSGVSDAFSIVIYKYHTIFKAPVNSDSAATGKSLQWRL